MTQLFALVSEALAGARALLGNDSATGLAVVEGDLTVDAMTAEIELLVWQQLGATGSSPPLPSLRHLVEARPASCPSASGRAIWPSTSPSAPSPISARK